jgi:hypothetical protein
MSGLQSVIQGVATIAPTVASMLGGPLAGTAVSALEGLFGITPAAGASVDDRAAAVAPAIAAATPDQVLALKKADYDFQVQMATIAAGVTNAQVAADGDQVDQVNQTMRAEVASGKGATWREACGWVLAIASFVSVLGVIGLFYVALVLKDMTAINMVPVLTMSIVGVLTVPGAAVGITAWHQGVRDRIAAGQ